MKICIEADNLLAKIVLEPNPPKLIPAATSADTASTVEPPPVQLKVTLEPLLLSIRQERYSFIKDLHIWNIPLRHEQVASLALVIEKNICKLQHVELMSCTVGAEAAKRLTLSFNHCPTISRVTLDYNEFGDAGCAGICEALQGNHTLVSLSMCYCGLEVHSGHLLGDLVAATALRELYVDGNDLLCEGAMELIRICADQAALEAYEREEIKRKKEEAILESRDDPYAPYASTGPSREGSAKPTKKKKKKGKKSKEPPGPPPAGPWIRKLHLAENGLDTFGSNGPYGPLTCMRLYRKLITHSSCLEELDLDDNILTELAAREVLEALQDRDKCKLSSLKLKTTHRLSGDLFGEIFKLGAGLKKKKKGKGKKKKK